MDIKKLRAMLMGTPERQPNMGDVKQADRSVGLGVRPQLVRGYGEDQDTMDSLRDNARQMASLGFSSNEPNEQDLENQKMIEGLASGAMGSVNAIGKLKEISKLKQLEKLRELLESQNFKVRPDAGHGLVAVKPEAAKAFGKVKVKP